MKVNDILEGLSIEDLNQRYRKTFIRYGNEIVSCGGFSPNRGTARGKIIGMYKKDGLYLEPFDHKKLDIRRPAPTWVAIADEKFPMTPMYLSYKLQRQWSRGFGEATCQVLSPMRPVYGVGIPEMTAWFDAKPVAGPLPLAKVVEAINTVGYSILSPSMAVVKRFFPREDMYKNEIYFRTTPIGTIVEETVTFKLPDFQTEFDDCVIR